MSVIMIPVEAACAVTGESCQTRAIGKAFEQQIPLSTWVLHRNPVGANFRKRLRLQNAIQPGGLVTDHHALGYELGSDDLGKTIASSRESYINGLSEEAIVLAEPQTYGQQNPSVLKELIMLSLPAIVGQAIEPLSQLMGTAYVGRLGVLELAAAGVSLSIFNVISKVFNIPLLSVATSFVAEDLSQNSSKNSASDGRRILPSVSTALTLSLVLGLIEAAAMTLGSGFFLSAMGVSTASSMHRPAEHFLRLRAIGAPAVVISIAIQGAFRGFKDTRTPVLCLGFGNLLGAIFFPISMRILRMGITGAAISTVASQYIVTILMMWHLNKKTTLQLPNMKNLNFSGYIKSGGFLMGRTIAVATTVTLSTSMVARLGALYVAAHQICLQLWLSASFLVDAQAAAGQALIASSFAKGELGRVREITHLALKTGLCTGVSLAIILGLAFPSISKLFTSDAEVLHIIGSLVLFISGSLPINAIAYVFDGLHYGISDFSYAGFSTVVVGAMACAFLVFGSPVFGIYGVWFGLTLFMGLRTMTGFLRLSSSNGPWWFLQDYNKNKTKTAILAGMQ